MLTVNYDNTDYTLFWNDIPKLVKFAVIQTRWPMKQLLLELGEIKLNEDFFTKEIFLECLKETNQNYCNSYLPFIPKSAKKIISVGSGISVFELIVSKYCTDSTMYLLDKSEISSNEQIHNFSESNKFGFYNSWDVVHDAIDASNLDKNRFIFLDPADDWCTDADVVMGLWSWCWAFPFEEYAEKLLKSLKIGGTLILEIKNPPDLRDVSSQISELMGGPPIFHNGKKIEGLTPENQNKKFSLNSNNEYGGLYVWTRKK
jgi:hypothetical protein